MTIDVTRVAEALRRADATWEAAENSMTVLSGDERRRRLGVPNRPEITEAARALAADHQIRLEIAAPSSWDWRDHDGVSPVTDQGQCGSCVSFATVAALESILRIEFGYAADLSEGDLHFCSSHGANCNGWDPGSAMSELENRGVCDEADSAYTPPTCNAQADRESRTTLTGGYKSYATAATFKNIISSDRPLVACFDIYDDFYAYSSGVYKHVTGKYEDGHCVEVIGYDDADQCWICKNSWGPLWGDAGFVKIGYGQCGIDDAMWQIQDPITLRKGVAFQANNGNLWTTGPSGTKDLQLGLAPGTSPAISRTAKGDFIAFQANTGNLWTVDQNGVATDRRLGMMAGTSPAIVALEAGYAVAFQANTGSLWTIDFHGDASDRGLGMMPGTSPAIAAVPQGYVVAFQANTGNLWTLDAGGGKDRGLGMKSGTSPSVATTPGGYEAAFQANTGNLWTVEAAGGAKDHGLGMMAGTSPSVAPFPTGWKVAFQANTGNLWTVDLGGARDHGLGMKAGTSPSVAMCAGGFTVAFQANTGNLWTVGPSGTTDHGLGMSDRTSPGSAGPA